MAVDIQLPPSHRAGMDRDVTHDKPLTLDVTSDVLEEIEILPHSCRFMITRYKTDPAFKLRNHLMHHPCGECDRSEEHTSELQSLIRISYADLCWKKKTT